MSYAGLYNPNKTPQGEKAKSNQVKNYAGGYVFQVSPVEQLKRFLILGSDSPTYYASARKMTRDNARVVEQLWLDDPELIAGVIRQVSVEGLVPKQDPLLFALALGALSENKKARSLTYQLIGVVCRIPTHIFMWAEFMQQLGVGNGPGKVRAFARWLEKQDTERLAFNMVKYKERHGFNFKRIIHKSNMGAKSDDAMDLMKRRALYNWAKGKEHNSELLPEIVQSHLRAIASDDPKVWLKEVLAHNLPWEALPTGVRKAPEVWEAMLPTMGTTAMIRNLGSMTQMGVLAPMSANVNLVAERLTNEEILRKARIHPFNVLVALKTYQSGKGFRGSNSWSPVGKIVDALDEAFYKSFKFVEPTGKRIMLAVDVSGSMGWGSIMNTNLAPREAAAAMAMITDRTELNTMITAFTTQLKEISITSRARLDDVVRYFAGMRMGATDIAAPVVYAIQKKLPIDAFIVYTDNETYAGYNHPFQALKSYRHTMGIDAKLITVAFTSTGFTIADPSDPGMLDIVGFDASAPSVMSNFIKSGISKD